jgi:hypothetical protein
MEDRLIQGRHQRSHRSLQDISKQHYETQNDFNPPVPDPSILQGLQKIVSE